MLYDYQSVAAVVEYINGALTAGAELAAGGGDAAPAGAELDSDSDVEDITATAQRQPRSKAAREAAAEAAAERPSELLKTLRPPPAQRPLFLAAPGVANAQSAYFSFSQFLQASQHDCCYRCCRHCLPIAACTDHLLVCKPLGP